MSLYMTFRAQNLAFAMLSAAVLNRWIMMNLRLVRRGLNPFFAADTTDGLHAVIAFHFPAISGCIFPLKTVPLTASEFASSSSGLTSHCCRGAFYS